MADKPMDQIKAAQSQLDHLTVLQDTAEGNLDAREFAADEREPMTDMVMASSRAAQGNVPTPMDSAPEMSTGLSGTDAAGTRPLSQSLERPASALRLSSAEALTSDANSSASFMAPTELNGSPASDKTTASTDSSITMPTISFPASGRSGSVSARNAGHINQDGASTDDADSDTDDQGSGSSDSGSGTVSGGGESESESESESEGGSSGSMTDEEDHDNDDNDDREEHGDNGRNDEDRGRPDRGIESEDDHDQGFGNDGRDVGNDKTEASDSPHDEPPGRETQGASGEDRHEDRDANDDREEHSDNGRNDEDRGRPDRGIESEDDHDQGFGNDGRDVGNDKTEASDSPHDEPPGRDEDVPFDDGSTSSGGGWIGAVDHGHDSPSVGKHSEEVRGKEQHIDNSPSPHAPGDHGATHDIDKATGTHGHGH